MGVGGHQAYAGQAAGGQNAEESQPAGAVFGGADLSTEDLSVPVAVDPGGHQRVDVDHPAAFAGLDGLGAPGHRRRQDVYGAASSRRVRKSATWVSSSAAIPLTCDLLRLVIPNEVATRISVRRVDTPSRSPPR